jgi:thiamine pyrophosphokinase
MTLPSTLREEKEWTFIGPIGPGLPDFLQRLPLVSIDGGSTHVDHSQIWVGDGDSLHSPLRADHIYQHPTRKDQSDLALALALFEAPLHYKFHFWGLLGGRKDHELFNFGEVTLFLENHPGAQVLFYDQKGHISFHFVGRGHWRFQASGEFSLGTFKRTRVKLTGECDYQLARSQELGVLSSFGLSNFGRGTVFLETDGPVFIHYPERP